LSASGEKTAPFDSAESFDLELFDLVVLDRLKTERLVAGHQSLQKSPSSFIR
jgi:hypothetical protein